MTEAQNRYHTYVENQRHNLQMERLGEQEQLNKERLYYQEVRAQDTAKYNAVTSRMKANTEEAKRRWEVTKDIFGLFSSARSKAFNAVMQGAKLQTQAASTAASFITKFGG